MKWFAGLVALCLWSAGCAVGDSTPDQPPAPAPSAAEAPPQAAPEQAAPRVVVGASDRVIIQSDRERYAKAFESGPLGQPEPVLPLDPETMLRPPTDPGDPGDPGGPVDVPASVRVDPVSSTSLKITYRCGEGANTLSRSLSTYGGGVTIPSPCGSLRTRIDSGLQPGTKYCYRLSFSGGTKGPACATTLYAPYLFNGTTVTQAESDQMAATFDWTHTAGVATTAGAQPALYSMKILVKNADDLYSIRGLGIHTQTAPLLSDEKAAWNGNIVQAMAGGKPTGVWITAIVPGPIYNDIRSQAIAGVSSGHPIGIRAMVFRRIGIAAAAVYPTATVSPLSITYLGQQGIQFNGRSTVTCDNGNPRLCSIEQGLLGWLVNKLITFVVDLVQDVVDGVRQALGGIERLVRGDVELTIKTVLKNSDEGFGSAEVTRSGWSGAPLVLKNLPLKVYQGVAEFATTSDSQGDAKVKVAKNLSGKVCVELDSSRIRIVDTFVEREICIGTFAATSSSATITIETADPWANQLAQMTDSADYLHAVMAFDMPKLSVLTGWQSAILTSTNGGRSFTPCMGRMPNLAVNIGVYSSPGIVTLLGEIGEFLTSYDIVLNSDNARSRGVGVHEYGHATMCEMLRRADQVKASLAWADVIVGSLTGQDATSEQAVIAEGFADFMALQVAGGTNYVGGTDIASSSRSLSYCNGASSLASGCFEPNSKRCEGAGCAFKDNVKWAVSVFQDTFDRVPTTGVDVTNPSINLPNDGSHWSFDGAKLVHHHAGFQLSSADGDSIQLAGPRIMDIFTSWAATGTLLRYSSFFGGLAKALRTNGFNLNSACGMFAAHEPSGTCPSYFSTAHGGSWTLPVMTMQLAASAGLMREP